VAEEKAQSEQAAPAQAANKPILFIILAVFNMAILLGVGAMIYMGKKKDAAIVNVDDVARGEKNLRDHEEANPEFIGQLIPLEEFLVNLAGSSGNKLVKINMELEVSNNEVQQEIDKLKPKIRDIIIMILSSKTYNNLSSKDGKDTLREEIRHQVNLFLTRGQIERVYFTELLFN
jgi:flagellar FliL protein